MSAAKLCRRHLLTEPLALAKVQKDIAQGIRYSTDELDAASRVGYLSVVKYLTEAGASCTTDAMDYAARNGFIHVVSYLMEKRKEGCTPYALEMASKARVVPESVVLSMVKRKIDLGETDQIGEWMSSAAQGGYLALVKLLHANMPIEKPSNHYLIDLAAINGHLTVCQFLSLSCGESVSGAAMDLTAMRGYMHDSPT
eukprot:gene13085-15391_t